MTQRQQIQKPHRMHPSLILQIPLHLRFQRSDVRQHIAMRDHHALRLSSSPRSKNNLQRIVAPDRYIRPARGAPSSSLRFLLGQGGDFDLLKNYYRNYDRNLRRVPPGANPKPRLNLLCNSSRKIPRRAMIHRNHNRATHYASKKRRNPLRTVLAPQHHPFALADPARLQFPAKPKRHLQNLPIGKPLHAVSAPLPVGTGVAVAVRLKVLLEKLC